MRRASMMLACGIVFALLLASCAGGSSSGGGAGGAAGSGAYEYEKDAISLHLKGDPKLNLFEKRPHTLLVCIYQLRDPNALNQVLQDAEDVTKLLECGRFDPSIVNTKKFILQPGKEITEALDRVDAEQAGPGEIIAVAGIPGVTIGETVRLMSRLTGRRAEIREDRARVRPERSEVMRLVCSNAKARRLTGWRPRVTLERGLARTVEYVRSRLSDYKAELYNV